MGGHFVRVVHLTVVALPCVMCGCVYNPPGNFPALPGMDSPALPPVGEKGASWSIWFWLALALLLVLAAVFGLGRRDDGRRGRGGPPLSREELALYRTARDALSFLIKKRLRALRVVSLEAFRLRRGA